jgi:hypothetical protein
MLSGTSRTCDLMTITRGVNKSIDNPIQNHAKPMIITRIMNVVKVPLIILSGSIPNP